MPLVTITDLTIGFRGPPLLDSISCQIDEGNRIGLLGRNGAGKTTLLKMIGGTQEPDSGTIIVEPGRHVALLQQDVPQDIDESIAEVVHRGLIGTKYLDIQDESESWKAQNAVEQILSRMELDGTTNFGSLSSGMKRRVLLAKALVAKPDLLLLDEPTNHLDIQAIDWLEQFLLKFGASLMFVTHDRMFLRRMATRILEIDQGRIFDWSCDYDTFLVRKEQSLAAEEKQNKLFDKRLAEEEVWIRQGIKARRTRNEGRVRALKKMREERSQRREKLGTSNLQINQGQKSGMLVAEATDISFGYDGSNNNVLDGFSTTVMRGDKIGIIGPNGAGKTTLLKILLGQLEPAEGKIKLGTNLKIAYFDQLREQLDPEQTVMDNVGDGYDHVQIGEVKKHIYGYLQDFLLSPERARTQIKFLSGGERNRILLAKLFTKTANLIVLDEPTNDLDVETLEMLEERLVEYAGTVLMVSHDRDFLNNVVTSTIVFENKTVREYVGGYDDWVRQRPEVAAEEVAAENSRAKLTTDKSKDKKPAAKPKKLKFSEKRELEQLPEKIEKLEASIAELHTLMADPEFYRQPKEVLAEKQAELKTLESELQTDYQRWEELEQLSELAGKK